MSTIENDHWNERYAKTATPATTDAATASYISAVDYSRSPFLHKISISDRLTGTPEWWLDVWARKFLVPAADSMLSIGAGLAHAEEHLVAAGYVKHVTAFEASPVACEAVKLRVADRDYGNRIEMRSDDILSSSLKDESFDVVFVQAAIHHFVEIEKMFALMHTVLKPGGLLIFDEYCGPDHHMYPEHLVALMNRINSCLSPGLRLNHLDGSQRERMPEPSLEWMLNYDPTEGVHASLILPLTHRYFEIVQRKDYGGQILRPFFTGIIPNFDFENEKDQTIARLIALLESELTSAGAISNHNVNIVARKRPKPRRSLNVSIGQPIRAFRHRWLKRLNGVIARIRS